MLLTDGGAIHIESWKNRVTARIQEIVLGHPRAAQEPLPWRQQRSEFADEVSVSPSAPQADLLRFRTRLQVQTSESTLAMHEQQARVLALRGLSQARAGEYERAQMSFTSAARLDPRLDLALLPSFWNLPRPVHEAAIAALHEADRGRDAAALAATMKMRFRPRALRAINGLDGQTSH